MLRLGLVDTLVTHANIKGFGLTPLSGDRRGYMPPLLKTKQNKGIQTYQILTNDDKVLFQVFLVFS